MGAIVSLFMNKYVLGALACLLLALGCYWGISSIESAYTERAALKLQVKQQLETIAQDDDAISVQVKATAEANLQTSNLAEEIRKRDAAAAAATVRNDKLTKDLSNAQSALTKWKKSAGVTVQSCLDVPLPASVFGDAVAPAAPAAGGG